MKKIICLILVLIISSCASSGFREKRKAFLKSSPEKRKEAVISLAKEFLILKYEDNSLGSYDPSHYGATLMKNGHTQEVTKNCERKLSHCEKEYKEYPINSKSWRVSLSVCRPESYCKGGFFLVYIDYATGEVLYYGGYK